MKFQSTHLHEVWLFFQVFFKSCNLFQSTHLHEVWLAAPVLIFQFRKFQSTHLHEVWHCYWIGFTWLYGFNPHTYMRCDSESKHLTRFPRGFNPHTYMRCDFTLSSKEKTPIVFQSTHLHEVWLRAVILPSSALLCFNPHTYMRCDRVIRTTRTFLDVSIHTPTWGVT